MKSLTIVHVVRDPLGGLFRHLMDLGASQVAAGHQVHIVCGGGREANARLQRLREHGIRVHTLAIARNPGVADLAALLIVAKLLRRLRADIVHGHGAKGGLYARLLRKRGAVYTPHGGVLHYRSVSAKPLFWIERWLLSRTSGLIFVSRHEAEIYSVKVGPPPSNSRVIYNGLHAHDFASLDGRDGAYAYDLAYVGLLRDLKGVDVLLAAIHALRERGYAPRVLVTGPGATPDIERYRSYISERSLENVDFRPGHADLREVLSGAEIVVMPSRAEALGYLALEVAALKVPIVASRAGGLAEVFSTTQSTLVEPGCPQSLANALAQALTDKERARREADARGEHVRSRFLLDDMVRETGETYERAVHRQSVVSP